MDTLKMLGKPYLPRLIDQQVQRALKANGAILLEGPRGCGKTMTGAQMAESAVFMDDELAQKLSEADPDFPLEGQTPHLIDEWQLNPGVWNKVRRRVDSLAGFGHFILTGSSVPDDDITRHTGAARILRIHERTMTWQEKLDIEPSISLAKLFNQEIPKPNLDRFSLDEVIRALLTSGFPGQISLSPTDAREPLLAYLQEISHADVYRIANLRHEPIVIDQILRSLARLSASEATFTTLRQDLISVAPNISIESVSQLVELLERLFIVETVSAWTPRLRSKARLRISQKYHLADASLAAAALRASEESLKQDLETLGLLFESAVIHDLSVMVEALGGKIYHFRDSNGYEIDAIAELNDGRWAALEMKLGYGQVEKGAERLAKAVSQIDMDRPPEFLAVISGTGATYTLKNGVLTFPLQALGL